MPRWPKETADAVLFDIRFGLTFKVGTRSRPATDQEIELVARTIVERLQQANWVIERGPPSPLGGTPSRYGPKIDLRTLNLNRSLGIDRVVADSSRRKTAA